MAKYPIPVHVSTDEATGRQKILTSKTRVKQLGANAFIVSKQSMNKLKKGEEAPSLDYHAVADEVMKAIRKCGGGLLPMGTKGAIVRGLKAAVK